MPSPLLTEGDDALRVALRALIRLIVSARQTERAKTAAQPFVQPTGDRSSTSSSTSSRMNTILNEFVTMRRRHQKAVRSANKAVDDMLESLSRASALLDGEDGNDGEDGSRMQIDNVVEGAEDGEDEKKIGNTNNDSVIKELEQLLATCKSLQSNLVGDYKSVGNAMNKYGKAIDHATETKLGELCSPGVGLSRAKIDDAIAQHLFREGMFEVGRTFVKETGIYVNEAEKVEPFERLYKMLNAFHNDDLQPAIEWTEEKKDFLRQSQSSASNNLQFRLHCLAYLQILQKQKDRHAALQYAKTHLSSFPQCISHVQKLMTCLLYADNLASSPYSSLVHPSLKDDIERCLSTQYCRSLGLTKDSHLLTVIRCGTKAIPTLLKATRVVTNLQDLGIDDALPVEIDIGRECCFHSIFTCPVSKEESSDATNLPMILLCGHVLSKQSVLRLPRGSHRFKCPYCPMEQVVGECKELYI